ncbi:RNase adapter RapZ, partial [Vibrio parahaemolyticus]
NIPKKLKELTGTLEQLKTELDVTVLFLDANKETLLKRYSETRRIHPLSLGGQSLSLDQAIEREKEILTP